VPAFRPETVAATAAVRAGLALVQQRVGADEVRAKTSPRDIVTGTDVAAQEAIRQVLIAFDASIQFVGEEGEHATMPGGGRYWLVDPLCGTSNFAAQLPFYAVNVALVEDGTVSAGVVADGVSGDVYVAERGNGAWLGELPLRVRRDARIVSLDPFLGAPGDLEHFGREFAFRALQGNRWSTRVLATTLSLSWLAAGRFGAAVYANPGLPVHFAAGLRIAEEAGAIVTDQCGDPWRPQSTIFLAAASPDLHAAIRALVDETLAYLAMT
jgi:myo-inositol-1(or 4)-monophosphatase